jgi:hypothetical protein
MQTTFFDVPRSKAATSAGEIDMPIMYRDGSLLLLLFRADLARASAVVPPAFEPMPMLGKAIVIFALFEYRETTIGRYNELGVGVQVKRRGSSPSLLTYARDPRKQPEQAIWVVNLPVTTEAARAGGVDVWGYPKYVTPIETEFGERGVKARLGDELSVEMKSGFGIGTRGLPFVTFTAKGGRTLRTIIDVDHNVHFGGASSVKLSRLGDGPTSKTVEALDLFGKTPWVAQRTDSLRAVLPFGVDIGDAGAEREQVAA